MTLISSFRRSAQFAAGSSIIALLFGSLPGCSGIGAKNINPDRFSYNSAIGQSANEQMLLNLLRIRYKEVPVFLSVSSVLTQYVYSGSAGVSGQAGNSGGYDSSFLGANAGVRYIERPTITYTPLSGEEFTRKLIHPIAGERIFSLAQSGWPPELLFGLCIEVIGGIRNLPFYRIPTDDDLTEHRQYRQVIELMIQLTKANLLEMRRNIASKANPGPNDYLVLSETDDPAQKVLIDRLKRLLNLSPELNRYRITQKLTYLASDEVTLRIRSMVSLMGLFARGVNIPQEHLRQGRARVRGPGTDTEITHYLNVKHSAGEPDSAFISVRYADYWFYIDQSDLISKEAFGLISYLFQMQAPQAPSALSLIHI